MIIRDHSFKVDLPLTEPEKRFIERAVQLALEVGDIRGKRGRDFIRKQEFGRSLDSLEACYNDMFLGTQSPVITNLREEKQKEFVL